MTRRQGLWVSGIATAVLYAVLIAVDFKIQDSGGPGIVGFELAGSTDRATEILGQWGESGRDAATLSLWLDFPFLIAYGTFLTLSVLAVRDAAVCRGWEGFARPGTAIAVLPAVAALADAFEDIGLLLVIGGRADTILPFASTGFAAVKFAALVVALAYLLVGLGRIALARIRATTPADSDTV